jgi:hypothetical protein
MPQRGSYYKTYVMRNVAAGGIGLVAAIAAIFAMHAASAAFVYAPPPGMEWGNAIHTAAFFAAMPISAQLFLILSCIVSGFVGGAAATKIASFARLPIAAGISVLMGAFAAWSSVEVALPTWLMAGTALGFPIGGVVGWQLMRPKKR